MSHRYTDEQIDTCLAMLVLCGGNTREAVTQLRAQGVAAPHHGKLHNWARHLHVERYEDLRRQHAEAIEGAIANDMREATREAVEASRLAVGRARELLEQNRDTEPAKTAFHLTRVAQINTDKMLTLTGRASRISETRDAEEIARKLIAMGVLKAPESPPEISEASVVDDAA
jgi:hypothetical protein